MQAVNREKQTFIQKHGYTILNSSIIIGVAILIFRNFIFAGGWPGGGDTLGWVAREYLYGNDLRWLNIWRPYSFGFVEGINSIDFFLMLINIATQNGATTVKVFMFSTFLLAGFSMYAFAQHYTHNKLAALSAALIYILNQWLFTQFTEGHLGILFGYALAPILLLLLSRALEHGKLKDMILFGGTMTICLTAFNPLSFVIYTIFLAIFTIFYITVPQNKFHFWKRAKRTTKVLIVSGTVFLFFSAFYIIPFLNNARAPFYSADFGYEIEEAFAISHQNMFDAFVLRGVEEWGYINVVDVTSAVSLQIIPISVILFIIFVMGYSTALIKTDKYTLFFLISGLVAVFVAKGPYPPFGDSFVWAWFNIPHFAVFRSASRFAMIIALSNAFFISVLVSIITKYISNSRVTQTKEQQTEITDRKQKKDFEIKNSSTRYFNTQLKRAKKFRYYFSILLLIVILLSGFFSCWFFIQNGLQVYKAPESFISSYEWIANQPEEFKIVTGTPSPGEWLLLQGAQTDFSSGGMLTSLGWTHDISSESSFIHDKAVLGDGGHNSKARQFVNYLRFRIARNYLSDNVLKVLGRFDYKYVVMPSYATENVKAFFVKQNGAEVVYNQSGSLILENTFYSPRVSSSNSYVLVVGGVKSYFTTSVIESFDLSQNTFIFVDQFANPDLLNDPVFESSKTILFDDTDLMDLVMASSENMNVIQAEQYALSTRNYSAYWGKYSSWGDFGLLAVAGSTLSTAGHNRVSIPFELSSDDDYEIMIRIGYCGGRGNLAVHVDSIPVTVLKPSADEWTNLKWVNLGSMHLEKGEHEISFTNDGTGWNDIDAVSVVKTSTLENQVDSVLYQLQNFDGRVVHILSAAHTFTYDIPGGWHINIVPYQGYVLESYTPSTFLSTNATILREGQYVFAVRLAQGPNQGTPQIRIDNTTTPLRLLNSTAKAEWYETEALHLNASSHLIEIGGSGKISFEQVVIYSLEEDEQSILSEEVQVHSTELGLNVSPDGNASASSVGVWEPNTLWANATNDRNTNTRWASKPHEKSPQWLKIEWETPQEISGARILFEQAYAEDYLIQTWSGTRWVTQATVEDNNQLNCTHIFKKPTVTNKIRLFVTTPTKLYDLVSVWEFEAYSQPKVSRTIVVPETGLYRVSASLVCGPEYGTLDFTINNVTTTVSCNSTDTEIKNVETEPVYLVSGEQNFTVTANGKADLYSITLNLNDEGKFGFLDNLVEEKQGPKVTYEEVNSCKYIAYVENSDEPFLLVFSEAYHPLWKAYIDDQEISPIPVYSIVNGFYVNKTGSFTIKIYFTGQTYADIGLQISAISIIVVLAIILIPSKHLEKFGKQIKEKIQQKIGQHNLAQTEGGIAPSE